MAAQQQAVIGTLGDQLHRVVTLVKRSFRHFWKAVMVGIVGLGISLTVAVIKKRVYMSEAVILYRQAIDPTVVSNVSRENRDNSKEIGARLEELLKARQGLKKVIDKHKLYAEVVDKHGYVEAVDLMRRKISFRVGQGDTFHVSFKGVSPEQAQQVTAELADSLIEQNTNLRQEQAETTRAFLVGETERLQKELERKQQQVARFLSENPEFALEAQPEAAGASIRALTVRAKQAAKGLDAQSVLQRQASRLRAQIKNPNAAVATGTADPRLVSAKERAEEELREARTELQRRKAQGTAQHPDVIAASKREASARSALARVNAAVKASRRLRAPKAKPVDTQVLKDRLAAIERQIAAAKQRRAGQSAGADGKKTNQASNRIVALETQWQKLNREVKQAREAYVKLEERLFKARLTASSESASQGAQLRVIDPAYLPTRPAGTGRTLIVAAGLVVSALFGGLLMLGLALVDHRIYDRFDVERLGLASVLVEIPKAKGKQGKRIKPGKVDTTDPG